MSPEEKSLLERVAKLSEDNHQMLKSLYSAMRWGRAWRIFYWVLIIGISIGAFYFIQPYIDQLMSVYSGIQGGADTFNSALEQYRNLQQ